MTALWTGVCLAYPALDALRAGYEVFPFVDAVGGTSLEAQRAGLERIAQAGAQPDQLGFAGLSQRDWARVETVAGGVDIVLTSRAPQGTLTPLARCRKVGGVRCAEPAGRPSNYGRPPGLALRAATLVARASSVTAASATAAGSR
jgi:hypothetical protein